MGETSSDLKIEAAKWPVESVSVVVPVWRRDEIVARTIEFLERAVHHALAMGIPCEVVVSAYQSSATLKKLIRAYGANFRLWEVDASRWNVARARNDGIRHSRGGIVVLLDADILVSANYISCHLGRHDHRRVLVVGPVNNYQSGPTSPIPFKTARHRPVVTGVVTDDVRWKLDLETAPLAWALCWSGNISFRRSDVKDWFDENFEGWGAEDSEWTFRLKNRGLRPIFAPETASWHQPHVRNRSKDVETDSRNRRKLFLKHPCLETEFFVTFGDINGNHQMAILRELRKPGSQIELGVQADRRDKTVYFGIGASRRDEEYQLLGMATPWTDASFERAEIAAWVSDLPSSFQERIYREAMRVARTVARRSHRGALSTYPAPALN